jgi:hypothetical protein
VSWKLSRTVLKPSRSGDAPAQGNTKSFTTKNTKENTKAQILFMSFVFFICIFCGEASSLSRHLHYHFAPARAVIEIDQDNLLPRAEQQLPVSEWDRQRAAEH